MTDRILLAVLLALCAFLIAWGIVGIVLFWGGPWAAPGFVFIAFGVWNAYWVMADE